MKKVILIMAALMMTVGAQAMGPIDFGVKAGINTENFKLNKHTDYDLVNKARVGYHAGAFARLSLLGLHVQPELVYNWNSYDIKNGRQKSKVKVRTVEVPILAGIELLFIRLNAGPVFNLMSKIKTSNGTFVERVDMTKPTVSFAAGLGIDLMQLSIDVRYCGQFKKSDSIITIDNEPVGFKNNFRGWQFSLGYKF